MKKFLLSSILFLITLSAQADGPAQRDLVEMWVKEKNAIARFEKILGVKVIGQTLHQLDNGKTTITPELRMKIQKLLKQCFLANLENDLANACTEEEANYQVKIKIEKNGSELEVELFLKDLSSISKDLIEFFESDLIKK